jgi:hypothetical protein
MYISDLFGTGQVLQSGQLFPIRNGCSDFLRESQGRPVFKHLPNCVKVCTKVKVRHKTSPILERFTSANVIQDSKAFVDTTTIPIPNVRNYWIFPANGYKYLFNPNVIDYTTSINKILENVSDVDVVDELIKELYLSDNLNVALMTETQILWYKISHFYAVDCSMFRNYAELLKIL